MLDQHPPYVDSDILEVSPRSETPAQAAKQFPHQASFGRYAISKCALPDPLGRTHIKKGRPKSP